MADDLWSAVKNVVNEALDYPPAHRKAFLDGRCAGEPGLRAAVDSLLEEALSSEGWLEHPLLDVASAGPPRDHRSLMPSTSTAGGELARPRPHDRGPFFWLVAAFGTVFIFFAAAALWRIILNGDEGKDVGWTADGTRGDWRITAVTPDGPAEGVLANNDQVVAFNGDARARTVGVEPYRSFLHAGSTYVVRISRDSAGEREFTLPVRVTERPGTALYAGTYLVLSVCFCAMALVIGLSKPQYGVARLGFAAGALMALRLLGLVIAPYIGIGSGSTLRLDQLAWLGEPCVLAVSYHFLYQFSLAGSKQRMWSILNAAIYSICVATFLVTVPFRVANVVGQPASIAVRADHPLLLGLSTVLNSATASTSIHLGVSLAICAVMLSGYYHRKADAGHRRRIRWVVFGCLCAFLPLVLMRSIELVSAAIGTSAVTGSHLWKEIDYVADVCLVAVPLSLAYAVVKYRVLGVSVVVRRSIQSLLARRVLQGLLLLPVGALLMPLVRHPNRFVTALLPVNALYPNLLFAIALGLSLRYRGQMQMWLDRKFFREAYDREALLRETLRRIKDADTIEDAARLAADALSAALHPSLICVLSRVSATGRFVVSHSSQTLSPRVEAVVRSGTAGLIALGARSPFGFELPSDHPGVRPSPGLGVPIINSDGQPVGLMILTEKQSDEPYHNVDRELLRGIGDQIGLVQEKLWLSEQLREEQRMRRDVLGHLSTSIELLWECVSCGRCFDAETRVCRDDGHELTHLLPIERLIAGRYRLDRRLGQGGMGAVYEAADLELRRTVAVKVTLGALFGNHEALRRFQREARAVARLHHLNVVEVHDFGRLGSDGAYLVMEFVHGSTWRTQLKKQGALPLLTVASWVDQLLDGLGAAHEAGVVHRDLKPENVLISRAVDGTDCVKLVDFGLAALDARGTQTVPVTREGAVMGTPGYMSPEQRNGQPCDGRTDLFAVGVMTVEAITGIPPWIGNGDYEGVINGLTQRLGGCLTGGPALENILRQCLAVDASRRFQAARELRPLLGAALRDCAVLDTWTGMSETGASSSS